MRLSKARCVALDNVSSLDGETSDLLCIASTGGSSTRRTLYTDDDEIALQLHATSILTAIDESIFGRSDLLSRAVILGLMKPPGGQQSERQTEALWTAALPVILGGLYAALSRALDKINWSGKSVHGRLAASVQVLEALDAAGVCGGGFVSVYASSRQAAAGDFVLRDEMLRDIIRTVLRQPMSPIDGSYSWLGSAAALYAAIGGNRHNAGKDWPRSEPALTRRLKYLAPVLDQVGVVVEFRRTNKARSIEIDNEAMPPMCSALRPRAPGLLFLTISMKPKFLRSKFPEKRCGNAVTAVTKFKQDSKGDGSDGSDGISPNFRGVLFFRRPLSVPSITQWDR